MADEVSAFVLCRGAYEDSEPVAVAPTLEAAQAAATWLVGGWEHQDDGRPRWRNADPEIPFTDWAAIYETPMLRA